MPVMGNDVFRIARHGENLHRRVVPGDAGKEFSNAKFSIRLMMIIVALLCSQWLDAQALQTNLGDSEVNHMAQGEQ
jgi:hypothetical protein